MSEERIIWKAEFNDSLTTYWLLNGFIILTVTLIGIPLIPIWWIGGKWFTRKYLASHECTLTSRKLHVAKGIFTTVEKTIPLDRITDLGIVQGPIMRYLGIEALVIETAGQSAVGSLVSLSGVVNGREFKQAVLNQRDLVVGSEEEKANLSTEPAVVGTPFADSSPIELLTSIRDTLTRIEHQLKQQ